MPCNYKSSAPAIKAYIAQIHLLYLRDLTPQQLNELHDQCCVWTPEAPALASEEERRNKTRLLAWMMRNMPNLKHPEKTMPTKALVDQSMALRNGKIVPPPAAIMAVSGYEGPKVKVKQEPDRVPGDSRRCAPSPPVSAEILKISTSMPDSALLATRKLEQKQAQLLETAFAPTIVPKPTIDRCPNGTLTGPLPAPSQESEDLIMTEPETSPLFVPTSRDAAPPDDTQSSQDSQHIKTPDWLINLDDDLQCDAATTAHDPNDDAEATADDNDPADYRQNENEHQETASSSSTEDLHPLQLDDIASHPIPNPNPDPNHVLLAQSLAAGPLAALLAACEKGDLDEALIMSAEVSGIIAGVRGIRF